MRLSWDEYFLHLAEVVSYRSTCKRAHHGTVIVQGKDVISVGYNGAPSDAPQCDEIGCLLVEGHCERTIHSEINALLRADAHRLKGALMYITGSPCYNCALTVANTPIKEVRFKANLEPYRYAPYPDEKYLQILFLNLGKKLTSIKLRS